MTGDRWTTDGASADGGDPNRHVGPERVHPLSLEVALSIVGDEARAHADRTREGALDGTDCVGYPDVHGTTGTSRPRG